MIKHKNLFCKSIPPANCGRSVRSVWSDNPFDPMIRSIRRSVRSVWPFEVTLQSDPIRDSSSEPIRDPSNDPIRDPSSNRSEIHCWGRTGTLLQGHAMQETHEQSSTRFRCWDYCPSEPIRSVERADPIRDPSSVRDPSSKPTRKPVWKLFKNILIIASSNNFKIQLHNKKWRNFS